MIDEIWKDIPNYEGLYQASNLGNIRTHKNKTTYTEQHGVRHWKQRILKPKSQNYETGYRVDLWKDGKPKSYLVARLIAITFLGESNLTVNHINGNRFDNRLENLEWCSLKENIQKGFETGLYHTQKAICIIDKEKNEEHVYRSNAEASRKCGYCNAYFSNKIKRNIFENKLYKWKLL